MPLAPSPSLKIPRSPTKEKGEERDERDESSGPRGEKENLSTEEDQHQIIPLQVTATPFATESRVPIAPLLGARLQLNFSMLNIRNGNVMLGPTPASEILHAPAQARSAELYGLGVSIPLGRGPRAQTSENLLRSAMRIVRGN